MDNHKKNMIPDPEILRHYVEAATGKLKLNNLSMVDVKSLKSSEKKSQKHSKKQLAKIKQAIKKVGYTAPVIIKEDGEIIAGELRLLAAQELKLEKIPAITLDNLTEKEADAIRIMDNRIAQDSVWDFQILNKELTKLFEYDFKFEDFGFDTIEYDQIFIETDLNEKQVHNSEKESATWLEANIPKVVKEQDLWRLGDHFILCGDSLNEKSYQALMQDELAQIILCDPPYNCKINGHVCGLGKIKHEEFKMASGEMTNAEFAQFIAKFMQNLIKFSQKGSLHYLFMDWKGINTLLTEGLKQYNELINLAVWNKKVGGMGAFYRSQHELIAILKNGKEKHQNHIQLGKNGRYRTNVWDYSGIRATSGADVELLNLHPTVKPIAMLHDVLLDASSKNDIVLDCFGGSGSTLLAAERCKRRARLIEINPRYVDVTIWRWEKETGKKAKLIKNTRGENNEQQ